MKFKNGGTAQRRGELHSPSLSMLTYRKLQVRANAIRLNG